MDTKKYNTLIEVDIVPEFHDDPPVIRCGVDGEIEEVILDKQTRLSYDLALVAGQHRLTIEFINKTDKDCRIDLGLDKKIHIGNVYFNGYTTSQFNWVSTYCPVYPEPWYSEQDPKPSPVHQSMSTLGWNGKWALEFESPVFPWIHRIENMGWVWKLPTNWHNLQ